MQLSPIGGVNGSTRCNWFTNSATLVQVEVDSGVEEEDEDDTEYTTNRGIKAQSFNFHAFQKENERLRVNEMSIEEGIREFKTYKRSITTNMEICIILCNPQLFL